MLPSLLANTLVNLTVGLALVMVWRTHRDQQFLHALGLSTLMQAMAPAAFAVWWHGQGAVAAAAAVMLAVAGGGSLLLLALGVARLAGREPSARTRWWAVLGLLALYGALVPLHLRAAAYAHAGLSLLVGGLAARWLWRGPVAERLSGVLLVGAGAVQFVFLIVGEHGAGWQAALGTVLRAALGLSLLYAAVARSVAAKRHLRDQYLRMTEKSHFGVVVIQGAEVVYANSAARQIYRRPAPQPIPVPWLSEHLTEEDRRAAHQRHLDIVSGAVEHAAWGGPRTRSDGRRMHLRFASWRIDWDGRPAEQVVVIDDTEHRDTTAALLHQATHDSLTGLPNRSALMAQLAQWCDEARPFALLVMDVDRFQLFNEAHGPSVGDGLLCALGAALREAVPEPAQLLRLGEDEFALLLPLNDGAALAAGQARVLAERVRARLREPLVLPAHRFYVDVSIGIALHPEMAAQPEALLRAAQAAVHAAKRIPGVAVCMADPVFERGSGASLMAEQGLRAGLRNEEFVLAFQPKRGAHDGRLTGFEALVRWQRPGAGLVSPADFIPAAERTGLIGPLGALILDKACAQVAAWQRAGVALVPVAVNVSPLQLLDEGFAALVAHTMAAHGVTPAGLSIEITESAAVAHLDDARQRILELRALGLAVSLDDFGAGISSLNILRSLPLQAVKLDRLLIDPLPAPDAVAVVRAVCQLAGALGMTVVAEGVETQAQADAARDAGCDELQGYHFGRPLPPADAEAWMRQAAPGTAAAAPAQLPGGTTAAMPALAICASSLDLTPLTPTAPTR